MFDSRRTGGGTRKQDVIQAIALYDENVCAFCCSRKWLSSEEKGIPYTLLLHESQCPVIVARDLLAELGTPVNVYVVSYEYLLPGTSGIYKPDRYCLLAMSEEDVQQQFSEATDHMNVRDYLFTLATPLGEH